MQSVDPVSTVGRFAERSWLRICAIPELRQDAILYLASACLAAGTFVFAVSNDYREWAALTMGPYLAAAVLCELVYRRRLKATARATRPAGRPNQDLTTNLSTNVTTNLTTNPGADLAAGVSVAASTRLGWRGVRREPRAPRHRLGDPFRVATLLALLVLTLAVPLATQLRDRADTHVGAQAQPEVAVIERAGDRAARFEDPYLRDPTTPGNSPWTDSHALDANSYFPYLPGMVFFGLVNAVPIATELRDARVTLSGFSLIIVLVALALVVAPPERRLRVFQVLVVLPTGSLPFVTGGDDLPVLALMLLALVMAQRRQWGWSGIVMGLAATLKFSAWGLLFVLFFAQYDREGRRAGGRYGLAALAVMVPLVAVGVVAGPHAFLVNVIEFPLDLAKVHSPAGSPLPGHEIVRRFPSLAAPLTVLLVGGGMAIVLLAFVRWTPRTPAAAARFTAGAIVLLVLLAPASRFGYLIYPVNLYVWATLVSDSPPAGAAASSKAGELVAEGDEDQAVSESAGTSRA